MKPDKFKVYKRLVWLAAHPGATAAQLAKKFDLNEDAARKFLDSQARRGLVERRVIYRVLDTVRL